MNRKWYVNVSNILSYLHVFTPISLKLSKIFSFFECIHFIKSNPKIIILLINRVYNFKTPNNYILIAFEEWDADTTTIIKRLYNESMRSNIKKSSC